MNLTRAPLMELLIMIDACKRSMAGRITAVIPYYGYAKQDRKAEKHEPITARLVANLLERSGANGVLTMDLHASQIQGFYDIPLDHLYSINTICEYFEEKFNYGEVLKLPPKSSKEKMMSRSFSIIPKTIFEKTLIK